MSKPPCREALFRNMKGIFQESGDIFRNAQYLAIKVQNTLTQVVNPSKFMCFSNPNQPAGLLIDVYFCLDTNTPTILSLSGHFFP